MRSVNIVHSVLARGGLMDEFVKSIRGMSIGYESQFLECAIHSVWVYVWRNRLRRMDRKPLGRNRATRKLDHRRVQIANSVPKLSISDSLGFANTRRDDTPTSHTNKPLALGPHTPIFLCTAGSQKQRMRGGGWNFKCHLDEFFSSGHLCRTDDDVKRSGFSRCGQIGPSSL